jgi:serine/threonine protein phosphatase PrpC
VSAIAEPVLAEPGAGAVSVDVWPRAYLLQVGDSRCYLLRRSAPTPAGEWRSVAKAQ